MRTISGFLSFACICFLLSGSLCFSAEPGRAVFGTRATARYARWRICIDEATIVRFATNAGLLLAADLLSEVTRGDAWNSYDDEGPSFKMLFKLVAGCAGMSVLFDRLVSSCLECPHCNQISIAADMPSFIQDISCEPSVNLQDTPESVTPFHKTASLVYNLGKLISVIRLGRTIYDVFHEDEDFERKCIVTPAALIGMGVLLKDLHASYQEYRNYNRAALKSTKKAQADIQSASCHSGTIFRPK